MKKTEKELKVIIVAPDALALRKMLAREHLGSGAPANLDDFNILFDAFKNVAAINRLRRTKAKLLAI